MTFVHPWMWIAGAAVALPVAIHWLTRPRPIRLPLSTIRFVREAVQQRRARHRLRDILLLLLRATAVLLLAIAFARPMIGATPTAAADPGSGVARVVVVDQSMGMSEVFGGATAFDRARAAAATYLGYSSTAKANLILAGAKPHAVVERLTSNFGALRDELSAAQALPQKIDTVAMINLAAQLLSTGDASQPRELVIVSNFQRSNWATVDFSALPKNTKIHLESVAPPQPLSNAGIVRVTPRGRIQQGKESRIDVEVGNYSSAARDVEVALTIGHSTTKLKGLCPPGVKTPLSAKLVIAEAGWLGGEARLVGVDDALMGDNIRPIVVRVRSAPTYLLVTRESASPEPTSSHFLERALAPYRPRDGASASTENVKRIAPEAFDADSAAHADLIVFDHPGKLSAQQMGLLASLLRRGKPVLYVSSESVDATNLDLLAQAAGRDLKMPVEFAPPPASSTRHNLFLTDIRRNTTPFQTFGDSLQAAVGPLRFGGGLASHPVDTGLTDDVLAGYGDHSACLVSTSCAAGTLAVLNVDLNQSNLPSSPVFVPMLNELVDRLLARQAREDATNSGEALAAYLPPEAGSAAGLKVDGPGAAAQALGTFSDDASPLLWRWNATGAPGVYTVKRDNTPVYAIAVAAPAITSDLTSLDPDVLKSRLAGDRTVSVHQQSDDLQHRESLWAWALVVCAACLLMELMTLRAFRT